VGAAAANTKRVRADVVIDDRPCSSTYALARWPDRADLVDENNAFQHHHRPQAAR